MVRWLASSRCDLGALEEQARGRRGVRCRGVATRPRARPRPPRTRASGSSRGSSRTRSARCSTSDSSISRRVDPVAESAGRAAGCSASSDLVRGHAVPSETRCSDRRPPARPARSPGVVELFFGQLRCVARAGSGRDRAAAPGRAGLAHVLTVPLCTDHHGRRQNRGCRPPMAPTRFGAASTGRIEGAEAHLEEHHAGHRYRSTTSSAVVARVEELRAAA